jgi:adenylate cyclase
VNLGDVIDDEESIYGDGVNVASRVEGLAEGGGICISRTAFDQVKNKLKLGYEYLGEHSVKNIAEPVRVYKVLMEPEAAGKVIGEEKPKPKQWRWAAIGGVVVLILVAGAFAIWNFYFRLSFEPASVEKMAFPLPEKPSIAVLPFDNFSGDPEQEYLVDGMTENIITALSKIPEVFVIARNSVFTYKGKPVKVSQVSEELGVRYVLEGSVQRSNGRLRITAQLIDATKGHHLWAERFDQDLKNIFTLQDEVTLKILSALRVKFTHDEHARVQETTDNLEAWGYFVRGLSNFQSFTDDNNKKARMQFEQAVRIDPGYSYAWAMLGWTHLIDVTYGFSASRAKSIREAFEIAQKAMNLDDKQPDVHALLGGIYLYQRQYENAIAEGERAVALGPNIACNQAILAQTMLFSGRFEDAIKLVGKAIRLNPYYPAWYLEPLAMAYGMIGQHDKAITAYTKLLIRRRKDRGNVITPLLGLTINCMLIGQEDEAKAFAEEIMEINPSFSLEWLQKVTNFKDPLYLNKPLDALRKAGLPETPPLPLPNKPSIAVLPFTNMSDDPKQEYFSDGITEEIITALSKTPKLFVIARNSTFTYKGKPTKVQQVGRELGVKYVLEGSVRKAGDKVRVTAQLVDAQTGHHLWAERYDRDMKDIFAIQDEITKKIITQLQVELTEGEQAGIYARGTVNLQAYLKFLEAIEYGRRQNPDDNHKAKRILEESIALDPNYAAAYRLLGALHMMDVYLGSTNSPKDSLRRAVELSRKAIALDESLGMAYALLGHIYILMKDYERGIEEGQRAVEVEPNDADTHAYLGMGLTFADRPEEAIKAFKRAIRLNPKAPSWYLHQLAEAYRHMGRYDEAIEWGKKAVDRDPKNLPAHLVLAACYSLAGREKEAQAEVAGVLRIKPNYSLERLAKTDPTKNQVSKKRYIDALRKAGLK